MTVVMGAETSELPWRPLSAALCISNIYTSDQTGLYKHNTTLLMQTFIFLKETSCGVGEQLQGEQ